MASRLDKAPNEILGLIALDEVPIDFDHRHEPGGGEQVSPPS
jgi:hypothetical protein